MGRGKALEARAKLQESRLYLITGIRSSDSELVGFLDDVLRAGVDVVQIREKSTDRAHLLESCRLAREVTNRLSKLLIVNDHVDVAMESQADGVHLGQDDMDPAVARERAGPDLIIGLSTHSERQILEADPKIIDYIGVGPVYETPTKPGLAGVGVELLGRAAEGARVPFFAIGGIEKSNLAEVLASGASRVAVLRAICDADNPATEARALKELLPDPR